MAINKKLIHFKNFEKFNSLKLSANEENTKYTLGVNGEVQDGAPDILYQSVVWIKDTQKQWTHGQMYNCSPLLDSGDGTKFLSDDGSYKTVESKFIKFSSNKLLKFYCIEPVTITINGEDTVYPANSSVSITLMDSDDWTITPTSNSSISTLEAWPGTLGTFYPWLEGVNVFDSIVFDMNTEDMYTKWNQGNQGLYHVQFAQYKNCIFWSDLAYISDVAKRTNYTLYYSSELPLCYSTIPDNTFKAFYFAYNVTCDPNWSNPAYKESFAKATWATQVFSYYGLHSIGMFDTDSSRFNITLPKDCRGLMFYAPNILNAGVFDAINVTNFGAKSGSWRDAFAYCYQLSNLYIKNLKVNLNISWSPVNQQSLEFILSKAANTNKITISLSPFTWYRLTDSNKALAAEKNITLELISTNSGDDNRLSMLTSAGDGNSFLANDGTYKEVEIPQTNVYTCTIDTDHHTDYNDLLEAVTRGDQIFIKTDGLTAPYVCIPMYEESTNSGSIVCYPHPIALKQNSDIGFGGSIITVNSGGFCEYDNLELIIKNSGEGTQFLSDDGSYKEIIHPEPYTLNYSDTPYEISSEELEKLRNAKEVRLNYYTEGGQAGGSGISTAVYNYHYHNYGTDDNTWTFYIDENYNNTHDFVGYIQASVNYDSETSTYTLSFIKLKNVNTYLLTSETYKYSDLEAAIDQGKQIIFQMTSDSCPYIVHELTRQSDGIMLGCLVMTVDGIGATIIMCGSDDIMFEPYTQGVISLTGDGNSFLADDGTYKTIGNNLEFFSFTDGEYITTDVYSRLSNKVSNQIPIASYINGNYLYSTGGYADEGLAFIFVDYTKITKVHIYRDNKVSISTYNVTSEINTLNNTTAALEERIDALDTNPFIIVPNGTLPESGESGKIYLTPASIVGDQNVMLEYVWVNNSWEKFGEFATNIDLSDYALKSEVATKISDLENDKGYLVKVVLTQAEYDALETKDPNALYVISDANETEDNNFVTEAQLESRGFLTQTDRSELKEYDDFLLGKISDLESKLTAALGRIATLESELENTLKV